MTAVIFIAIGLGLVALLLLAQQRPGERLWDPLRPSDSGEAWLEIRAGAPVGEWLALAGTSLTIGRHESNRLIIDDPAVTGRHATVAPFHGGWAVRDIGGEGIALNEVPIRYGGVRLRPGDTITIGPVRLRYHQSPPPAWATVHRGRVKLAPAPRLDGARAPQSTALRSPSRSDLQRVVRFLEQEIENNRGER